MKKCICVTCNRPTNHKVVAEKKVDLLYDDNAWWEENRYQIIQCEGCESVSYRTLYTDAQMCQQAQYSDVEPDEVFSEELDLLKCTG